MTRPTRKIVLKQLSELNARWVDRLVARGATTDEYGQPVGVTPEQEDEYLSAVQRVLEGKGIAR
jgi:hypothetical protein